MNNHIVSHNTNIAARNDIFFALFVFIFFFIFYSVIHPLIPIDLDDWSYIIKNRILLPIWGAWNPVKIFPEFFYPLMSSIGAYVFYSLNNDYLQSQCIIHSIVVSLSITGYTLSFLHFIRRKFELSSSTVYMLSILFLMLHFLIFRTEETNNIYMFYANDVNCYYNYIIPDLLCSSLVLSLLSNDWLKDKFQPTFKNSIIIVLLYLAICSNLYSSIILGGYIVSILLIDLIHCYSVDKKYIDYFKSNIKKIIIVVCWLVVHLFEAFGLRAQASSGFQVSLFDAIKTTLYNLVDMQISKVFLILVLISVIYFAIDLIKKQCGGKSMIYQVSIAFTICLVYIILLSAKVSPDYIISNNGNFSFFFYLILFVCITLSMIVQKIKVIKLFIPFIILLFYSFINRTSNTFSDIWRQYDYKIISEITRKNVNDIITADKNNITYIEIIIPKFNNLDNWPLKLDLNYSNALYKHGVIKSNVKIKLIKRKNIFEWNNITQSHDE